MYGNGVGTVETTGSRSKKNLGQETANRWILMISECNSGATRRMEVSLMGLLRRGLILVLRRSPAKNLKNE